MSAISAEIWFRDIEHVGALLRARTISPVELVADLFVRIDRMDAALHAFSAVARRSALVEAEQVESDLRHGRWRGPLHGIPIAMKDLVHVRGLPTANGMRIFENFHPERDATLVERLRAAGAILIGKLTMTEGAFFAHHPTVEPASNPWNPDYWPGASSSGPASALAAGLCFGAIGSDTGGSIRIPAACCGVTGLKPTHGLVSHDGSFPLAPSLDCLGPMARSARGVAAMLGAVVGDTHIARTSATAAASYDSNKAGAQLRIGIDDRFISDGLDEEVAAVFEEARRLLTSLGCAVRTVCLPEMGRAADAWTTICAVEALQSHQSTFPGSRAAYGPYLAQFLDMAGAVEPATLAEAHIEQARFSRAIDQIFAQVDMLFTPVMPMRAPSLAETDELLRAGLTARINRFTEAFNLAGHPAISFPAGLSSEGLPIGMQLIGRRWTEPTLCDTAEQFQRATDWHIRVPPCLPPCPGP